jgi:hypothetical protein
VATNDAARSLQDSVERLAAAFERMSARLDTIDLAGAPVEEGDRVTRHVRRFMPFYALAAVWAVMLILLPTRGEDSADAASQASALTPGAQTSGDGTGDMSGAIGPTTADPKGVRPSGRGAPAGGTPGTSGRTAQASPDAPSLEGLDPLAWDRAGKTRGGFDCKNGVRQIPWSAYAVPCFPAWSGTNDGATYRGVTAKEIVIVRRTFPESANSQAVDAIAAQAGAAPSDVTDEIRNKFRAYFNKVFELWGRKVRFVDWESQYGDSTAEAQGRGKEGACADANIIANELKAFGVMDGGQAFSECAAERKMMVFNAAGYYPESYYDRYHPYLWNGVPDCERISYQLAEYMGKRLVGRPAKWAKGLERNKQRKFAVFIPNNDAYQTCGNRMQSELKAKYNSGWGSRYNYTLDISRLPDEAAKAIIQFKADGATTIVLACDPFSPIFLTQSAKSQSYNPEWIVIGVALTDVDNVARLWDQSQVTRSLFGMSQLGATEKILGPGGEAPKTYKIITGTEIAPGTTGDYHGLVLLFNALQAAGPTVTPETVASAFVRLPPGGAPRFEVGYASYRDGPDGRAGTHDHTAIDDAREIWWNADGTGFDGKKGLYEETMSGKRFRNGEWPKGDPQVFE